MAIESNLLGARAESPWSSLAWRFAAAASSLVDREPVCRQWVSGSAQHPVRQWSARRRNTRRTEFYVTLGAGTPGLGDTTPRLRPRGWLTPLFAQRSNHSIQCYLRSSRRNTGSDRRHSRRANSIARFSHFRISSISCVYIVRNFPFGSDRSRGQNGEPRSYDESCRSGGACCDDGISGLSK